MVVAHMRGGGTMRFTPIANPILANTQAEARFHVRALYRRVCRNLPMINHTFELPQFDPHFSIQNVKNQYFVPNLKVTDITVIEELRYNGDMEFAEAANMFKTKQHVYSMLTTPEFRGSSHILPVERDETRSLIKGKPQSAFMTEFLRKG